ncbi:MAG: hypothetical protein GY948_07580 [Alphaproteobacteria bacterium]|nr:hypothetical protein [Alphaproteobacteria bacterium]
MASRIKPANPQQLRTLVEAQLATPAGRQVEAIAGSVRAAAGQTAGGDPDRAVAAVLGYGSCLRDVSPAEGLADFYVLMADEANISTNPVARLGCRIAAPNVYYAECAHEGQTLRSKYAVLPLRQFERCVSQKTQNPYFWARFAQPSALIWVQEGYEERMVEAIQSAIVTMLHNGLSLADGETDQADLWLTALQATYGTELRSESADRARHILSTNPQWYDAVARAVVGDNLAAALDRLSDRQWAKGRSDWKKRRLRGKALSVLRLIKAAFTFKGGADYLAWKIERHSGVAVKLSGWQRRHPILASVWLMPKLYFQGAFK